MSWSASELGVGLAPLSRFRPSGGVFYWPFQGGAFFCGSFVFLFCLVFAVFCARLFVCALWCLLGGGGGGGGWPLGSRLWCLL